MPRELHLRANAARHIPRANVARHRFCLCLVPALLGATLLMPATAAGAGDDLEPREQLSQAIFRAGGAPRAYTRLTASDRASYLFCGQGELEVLSRAVMPPARAR